MELALTAASAVVSLAALLILMFHRGLDEHRRARGAVSAAVVVGLLLLIASFLA